MNNYEYIKTLSLEELAKVITDYVASEDGEVRYKYCKGWLESEHQEEV